MQCIQIVQTIKTRISFDSKWRNDEEKEELKEKNKQEEYLKNFNRCKKNEKKTNKNLIEWYLTVNQCWYKMSLKIKLIFMFR